jgi:hypothetical protein
MIEGLMPSFRGFCNCRVSAGMLYGNHAFGYVDGK